MPRLGCHRYAVLRAPLPRRSSPLPRLLAQAFGGHQRRAPPPRTTYQWQRTTTEYVQHRSYYRLPRIKESSIKVNRVMVLVSLSSYRLNRIVRAFFYLLSNLFLQMLWTKELNSNTKLNILKFKSGSFVVVFCLLCLLGCLTYCNS